jgi:hypothetical protein
VQVVQSPHSEQSEDANLTYAEQELKRKDELKQVEQKFMKIDSDDSNENLKTLTKQAGKYKKETAFKPFLSAQLQQIA